VCAYALVNVRVCLYVNVCVFLGPSPRVLWRICSRSPLLNFSRRRIHAQTHTCTGLIEAGLKVALQREDITYLRIARMILGTHFCKFVQFKCFWEQNVVSLMSVIFLLGSPPAPRLIRARACLNACVRVCVRATQLFHRHC